MPAILAGAKPPGESVVLDRLRLYGVIEFGCRTFAEGTELQPVLTLDGVPLPVPLRCEIFLDRCRKSVDPDDRDPVIERDSAANAIN